MSEHISVDQEKLTKTIAEAKAAVDKKKGIKPEKKSEVIKVKDDGNSESYRPFKTFFKDQNADTKTTTLKKSEQPLSLWLKNKK